MKSQKFTKTVILIFFTLFTVTVFADDASTKPTPVPTPVQPLNEFNSPTFSQAPPTQPPNPAVRVTTKPTPKAPPNDMAIPTAPTSAVNTPSMNPAMPVSKPSRSPASTTKAFPTPNNGVNNTVTTPNIDATTKSTPVPPSPVPNTAPAPTNTQESPSLIKPNAAPVDKEAEPAASSPPPVH